MTANAPKDPYNFVLGLMYYLAIGTLLPWNFFINVNGYWMYKFRTVANNSSLTPSATESASSTLFGGTKNSLQIEFTSDLAIAAMIPNVTFLVLNGLFGHRFRTTPRLVWSLALVVLLFTATLVLVKVDTDHWQDGFLVLTLAIVVLINIFTALFQGGLIGLAGAFPSRYMNAVMSGQVFVSPPTLNCFNELLVGRESEESLQLRSTSCCWRSVGTTSPRPSTASSLPSFSLQASHNHPHNIFSH